ncbi:uncharacterized protein A1O9_05327 [Exophiala aquamarina CBS 119918]|uniref:FAS1 domain-containing protein n=1 Tax=Exophiala aquamarina CBS 119918 TaxID=1182545 RepID=A0A072PPH7_9EURO|nr:uncharacterized protein A1O9_05327 [Exophiala aquamarina CBS 119918]KEF57410.1 hypothetical protein A1O9_05327 [Exophiala aquamarina CBS 119918]
MLGLRKFLVVSTFLLGALSSPRHTHEDDNSIVNWDSFQALLDSIEPAALHSVLHSLSPKFQDGVFSKDRSAIEHVHSENPVVASKLVHIAKKRQESNSTTTASSTTTSTPAQSTSDEQSSSRAASVSSVLSSAILASTVPGATTVTVAPAAPASATAVATTDGAVVFSTVGGGLVTLTSSAVGVSFSPSTSTHLFYETAADGSISTSTSVVVVNAPLTDSPDATGAAGAAATTGGNPGLQDAATSIKISGLLMACAAFGAFLFVQ